jgi:TonB family protein
MMKWIFALAAIPALATAADAPPAPAPASTVLEAPPYPADVTPAVMDPGTKCHLRRYQSQPSASGTPTIIGFTVNADGTVQDVSIVQSSGDYDRDNNYLKCTTNMHFTPAMKSGAPIAVHTRWSN